MANSLSPKVSVIVPSYNHARFLRKRLDSVLAQTFQDFEVIVLDDCSTDESLSILSQYRSDQRVRIELSQKNSGSTFKQWNKGVQSARGTYVWIAESDDYSDVRLLERLVSILDRDSETVFCYCRSNSVSEDGQVMGFVDAYLNDLQPRRWEADFWVDGREECTKYLVQRNTITGTSSVLFRKDVFQEVGGADESLIFCGDWKTWASMALTGGKIAYLAEPLNFQRFHGTSVTTKSQQLGVDVDEYMSVIRWILQRVTPTEATQSKLRSDLFPFWSAKVLTNRTPAKRRWRILKNAMAIDDKALSKLIRPAYTTLRFKLSRALTSTK